MHIYIYIYQNSDTSVQYCSDISEFWYKCKILYRYNGINLYKLKQIYHNSDTSVQYCTGVSEFWYFCTIFYRYIKFLIRLYKIVQIHQDFDISVQSVGEAGEKQGKARYLYNIVQIYQNSDTYITVQIYHNYDISVQYFTYTSEL